MDAIQNNVGIFGQSADQVYQGFHLQQFANLKAVAYSDQWKLKKMVNSPGSVSQLQIDTMRYNDPTDNASMFAFRATLDLPEELHQVWEALLDFESCCKWDDRRADSIIFGECLPFYREIYGRWKTAWPLSNRKAYMKTTFGMEQDGTAIMSVESLPDGDDGIARMQVINHIHCYSTK